MIRRLILFLIIFLTVGCGVKGDPLPPEEPVYIGRGKPSFRKGVERFDIRTEEIESEREPVPDEEKEEEE